MLWLHTSLTANCQMALYFRSAPAETWHYYILQIGLQQYSVHILTYIIIVLLSLIVYCYYLLFLDLAKSAGQVFSFLQCSTKFIGTLMLINLAELLP